MCRRLFLVSGNEFIRCELSGCKPVPWPQLADFVCVPRTGRCLTRRRPNVGGFLLSASRHLKARSLNRYRFRPAYIRTMSTIPNTVPSATIRTLWRPLFSSSSMTNLMASPRLLNSRCPGSFVDHCTNTTSLPIGAPSRSLAANGLSLESTRNFGWDIAA